MTGSGGPRDEPSHLVVGHIARVHGMKGELFVWPLTDRPELVLAEGATVWLGGADGELAEDALQLEIDRARPFKKGVLVGFRAFADRTAVEPFAGRYLLAPTATLTPPEPAEWYYHQLLGLEVRTLAGGRVGRVREVFEMDPADMLEVEAEAGRVHLVPLTQRIVRRVDIEAGVIEIDPPDGLLEL